VAYQEKDLQASQFTKTQVILYSFGLEERLEEKTNKSKHRNTKKNKQGKTNKEKQKSIKKTQGQQKKAKCY
jgi:hypothetical protein